MPALCMLFKYVSALESVLCGSPRFYWIPCCLSHLGLLIWSFSLCYIQWVAQQLIKCSSQGQMWNATLSKVLKVSWPIECEGVVLKNSWVRSCTSALLVEQQKPGELARLWPAAVLPRLLPGEVCAQGWPMPGPNKSSHCTSRCRLPKRPLMFQLDMGCFVELLPHASSCCPFWPCFWGALCGGHMWLHLAGQARAPFK